MNKPRKPRKPSPKDKPPQEYIWDTKFVAVKGDDVILVDSQYPSDGYRTSDLFPLNKAQIGKLIDLCKGADEMDAVEDYIYSDTPCINYAVKKSVKNTNYVRELDQYNNRFKTYDAAILQYESDLREYNNWRANKKQNEEKRKKELKASIVSKLTKEEKEFLRIG